MTAERKNIIVWASFLMLMLTWGSSFKLVKNGLSGGFEATEVATIRMLAAWVVLVIPGILSFPQIPREKIWWVIFSGLISMFIPAYLFAIAQTRLEGSIVSILNAMTPAFTFIIGVLAFRQPMNIWQSLGLFIGFLGSLLLTLKMSDQAISINEYAFLVLAATLCYGLNVNIVKYKLTGIKSYYITTTTVCVAGSAALLYLLFNNSASAIVSKATANPGAFASLMALGMLGTAAAQLVFNYMLTLTSSVFASAITYFIPVVAIMWSYYDGKSLTFQDFIGMILIFVGVLILNRFKG